MSDTYMPRGSRDAELQQDAATQALLVTAPPGVPVNVDINPPTAVLSGQVTLAAAAAPLVGVATPCKSVTLENPNTNAVCYVGPAGVTALTGYRLQPGATVSLDIDDLNKVYVLGTAGNIVSYIAVN